MKIFLRLIISLYFVICGSFLAFATDYTVDSPNKVPTGYSPGADGWYANNSSSDRYKVSATSGNAGNPGNSSPSQVADSNDSTSIYSFKADSDIKNGNFSLDDIPRLIVSVIELLLGVAGTISIVALIYHAVHMQLASGITGDSSGVDHAKKGMKGALIGFVVAMSAWFIIYQFVNIMSDTIK